MNTWDVGWVRGAAKLRRQISEEAQRNRPPSRLSRWLTGSQQSERLPTGRRRS